MHGRRRTQVSDFSSERGEGRTYLFTHSSAGDQLIVPTGRDQSPSCSHMSQMITKGGRVQQQTEWDGRAGSGLSSTPHLL